MTVAARPRFPVVLTVLAVVLLGVLLALGVWQVQRMQWKEGLIAGAEAAADQLPLPLAEALKVENPEFRRVILTCRGLSAAAFVELQSIENSDAGVRLVSACAVDGGPTLLVDRGFVSADISARPPVNAADTMPVVITGVLRRSPPPMSPSRPRRPPMSAGRRRTSSSCMKASRPCPSPMRPRAAPAVSSGRISRSPSATTPSPCPSPSSAMRPRSSPP